MIGLEEYGLEVDVAGIRMEVHAGFLRSGIDMLSHVFEGSAERAVLFRMVREEGEVFHRIPEGARSEGEDDEGEEDNFPTSFVSEREVEEEEYRKGREEEDGNLGTDGAEGMRETLIRQVFRSEHDEKNNEEEGVSCEMGMVFFPLNSRAKELPGLSEEEEESSEKECADDRIEDGIGRVIVTEILIADEVVFNERESDGFAQGAKEIAVIHFG